MTSGAATYPARLRRAPALAGEALRAFDGLALHEQAALLTIPLLLLYADDYWYVNIPVISLAVAGLVFPGARANPIFWFTLACFTGVGVIYNWHTADNHKFLLCYWCLTIFFALSTADPSRSLRISARWLVGLTFMFATLWKVFSADFLTGGFFEYALLFDPRFSGRLEALRLIDRETLELNRAAYQALTSYDSHLAMAHLAIPPSLQVLATGMARWTVVLEAAIAIAFLSPGRTWIRLVGHACLLAFIGSTYLVAPVVGFGWLLIVTGFVQCDRSERVFRLLYLAALPALQLYRLPWSPFAGAFGT